MVDFPILEEFKNFIYVNIETIFLVVMPLAALIGWLTNRISRRLKEIEDDTEDKIKDLKSVLQEARGKLDKLYGKINRLEVDVISDIESIKTLLNQGFKDANYLSMRKKRNDHYYYDNNNNNDDDNGS